MEFSPVDNGLVSVILLTFLVQSPFQFCALIFVATHVSLRVAQSLQNSETDIWKPFISDTYHLEGKGWSPGCLKPPVFLGNPFSGTIWKHSWLSDLGEHQLNLGVTCSSGELRHKLNKVTTAIVPSAGWCDVKRHLKGVTTVSNVEVELPACWGGGPALWEQVSPVCDWTYLDLLWRL